MTGRRAGAALIRARRAARGARRGDEGSALVEFCWLAILLMVPLTYIVLVVFRVQAASYGVAAAARDAGRAFVTAESGGEAPGRAELAAAIVLKDQGVELGADDLSLSCSASPCLTPGGNVTIRITTSVRLPLLPAVLADAVRGTITVEGTHLEVVDPYSVMRP